MRSKKRNERRRAYRDDFGHKKPAALARKNGPEKMGRGKLAGRTTTPLDCTYRTSTEAITLAVKIELVESMC